MPRVSQKFGGDTPDEAAGAAEEISRRPMCFLRGAQLPSYITGEILPIISDLFRG